MLQSLMVLGVLFSVVLLAIAILCIPIMIANARGVCGGGRTAIVVLSWLGIFFGVTWFVALMMALLWDAGCRDATNNLDKLEQLARLYKNKTISKAEYQRMKSQLIGE